MALLERAVHLDALRTALTGASSGAGCIVLVGGEAGIGKTALVDEFLGELAAASPPIPVLWGACDPLFTPRTLGPLLDMLPQCSEALRGLVEGSASRERLFAAFLDELRRHDPPPVVVFEDIHWADEATLDLLRFVGRRVRSTSALVLATYRDDEVGPTHPLRLVLGEMKEGMQRLRLPLLTEAAVARLALHAGRSGAGLHALTGGNPFFVTEVLAGDGAGVPESVQDAVLAHAARLSTTGRRALDPVSVVPRRAERWLLDALPEGPGADQVAECAEAGVLVATQDTVSFRHELARRAWEETLEPGYAAALHAQVLDALLEQGADRVGLARLVHHADRAGQTQRILRLAPAAAREAAALGAHREAAAHYATALRYADGLPGPERAALLEAHSVERYLIAELGEAVRAREGALSLRRALDDRLREGTDVRWLSRLAWFHGRPKEAAALGREAIRVLEPLGETPELAMAYSNLAHLAMLGDATDGAAEWGGRAIALAERLGDFETLAHALTNVGIALIYAGESERGAALVERSLAIALENGFHEHAARAYANLACHAVSSRDYAVADTRIAATLTFAADHEIETFTLYMLGWRARLRLERGEWEAAEADARSVLDRYRILDVVRLPALTALGLLRARQGEADAGALLEESYGLAAPTREMERLAPAAAARAEAAWIRGEPGAALEETRAACRLSLRSRFPWHRGPLVYWLWRAGGMDAPPASLPEPYRLQIERAWCGAAEAWQRIGCPYERALALAETDDRASQREALEALEALGAHAAASAVRRDLRGRGIRGVPRGPRPATRANPAGLTRGQSKVLVLLAEGRSNTEIARQLFLSPRTVDHHVSAILQRLGVRTRARAVAAARARRILPEE